MTRNHTVKSAVDSASQVGTSRVIAVGASAGGLVALKIFFQNIPSDDNNSYVVIQHLSPDYKSMMGGASGKINYTKD